MKHHHRPLAMQGAIASLRSLGVQFDNNGPKIPDNIPDGYRIFVDRRLAELKDMMHGEPKSWRMIANIDTRVFEDLFTKRRQAGVWAILDDDGDDLSGADRVIDEWAEAHFGQPE